jgi:hypothetical protein
MTVPNRHLYWLMIFGNSWRTARIGINMLCRHDWLDDSPPQPQ